MLIRKLTAHMFISEIKSSFWWNVWMDVFVACTSVHQRWVISLFSALWHILFLSFSRLSWVINKCVNHGHWHNFLFSSSLFSDQVDYPEPLESTLETYSPDPMLSSSAEPQTDELLQYLNNPNNFSADFLPSDSALPDLNLSSFISMPIQACGGIYLWNVYTQRCVSLQYFYR